MLKLPTHSGFHDLFLKYPMLKSNHILAATEDQIFRLFPNLHTFQVAVKSCTCSRPEYS